MSRQRKAALVASLFIAGMALSSCSDSPSADTEGTVNSDCTPAHEFDTIEDGVLKVATPELAPFSAYNNGSPEGIDVEIVEAIADLECLTPEYIAIEYSGAVPAVQSGRADIAIGDYYRTSSRAEIVGLSDPMYFDGMGIISKDGVTDLSEILERKVGTVDGYLWVADMKELLGSDMKIYKSNVEMWADLEAGRIEIGIDSIPVSELVATSKSGWEIASIAPDERVGASVKPAQSGLPFTKENAGLETALNEDIATLRDNGTLADIFTQFGVDPAETEVTEAYLLES